MTAAQQDDQPAAEQAVFPAARRDHFAPPPAYRTSDAVRQMRLSYGGSAWLVTGHREAREVLADHESFSSDPSFEGFPAFPLTSKRYVPGHFLSMDPPEHGRLRRQVAAEFSGSNTRRLRPRIEAAARELVGRLAASERPADLVDTVAVPLPAMSASELLGTPLDDRDFFLSCARDLQVHDATVAQRVVAAGRMDRYLRQLVVRKREERSEDLLGRLARAVQEDVLVVDEVIGIANLIIVAGLETTAGLVALTMLSLLVDAEQGDLVRADPTRWAGPAVNEALRYWTLAQHGVARVATREVEVGGRTIRRGDAVVVHLATANRDPAVYAEPDAFDLRRDPRGQLAFGHGVHRCLGSSIAQVQAEVAIQVLMEELPNLRLACAVSELNFLDEMLIYGLRSLPVTW
ncbi:cytochrome P450 [Micromonospora sp. NPDC050187]|uniref:cytochrome P450 n=1 Tax=Micromonospora sp. NPDC050187 TaxID=3364277 RepID=UPI00379D78A9